MDSPDRLMRAARHFEGAAARITSLNVRTAKAYAHTTRPAEQPQVWPGTARRCGAFCRGSGPSEAGHRGFGGGPPTAICAQATAAVVPRYRVTGRRSRFFFTITSDS